MKETFHTINQHKETLLLIVILIIGAALRIVALGSVPPGLHFDEAVYGLMASEIGDGYWPVFFSAYTGREPLYMYLMAGVFQVTGVNALGIRLTSALIGTATIWLAYLLFRELFPDRAPRLPLLTAALTAIAYWHITVSRNGYPNIAIPPLECLALLFLWRGYRKNHKGWMALGGAFIGLVLYTYLAARLFPITVALFFIYALLVNRKRFLSRFWGIALAALISVLVFAPLGLHFVRNPQDFWERADQVLAVRKSGGWGLIKLYTRNILDTMGGFFVKGDIRQHFNLPGKPIFDPVLGTFFVLGVITTIKHWRSLEYALLPIWVAGMTLPALLTAEPMPQSQRMFGIVPAVFGLAALGIDATLRWIEARDLQRPRQAATVLLILLLLFETASTVYAYFFNWGQQRATYSTFHAEQMLAARAAAQELEQGDLPVLQAYHYKHPTIVFTAPRTAEEAIWTFGGDVFVVPNRPADDVIYLRMRGNPASEIIDEIERVLTERLAPLRDPQGGIAVTVRRLKPDARAAEVAAPALAAFADETAVLASTVPETLARDEALRVLVHWRVQRPVDEARDLRVHLMDANGVLWAQSGSGAYLSDQWRTDDTVYQVFEVALPSGIPAGTYEPRLVLSREGGGQLPVFRDGEPVGISLPLGDITLLPEGRTIQPLSEEGTPFGDVFVARDSSRLSGTYQPGSSLQFEVTWQAQETPSEDYAFRLAFVNAEGVEVKTIVGPLAAEYPTSVWARGEVVRAITRMTVPSLPEGEYTLQLTVDELPGEISLGQITLGGLTRRFEIPPIPNRVRATLGESIALHGYALPESDTHAAGESFPLRLYWEALGAPQGDYKVFVHVIDANGAIWGQSDSVPANWQRPTRGWATGEIIVDEHSVPLKAETPAGRYQVAVGMYDSETLQRLPLLDEKGERLSDDRLVLTTITVE